MNYSSELTCDVYRWSIWSLWIKKFSSSLWLAQTVLASSPGLNQGSLKNQPKTPIFRRRTDCWLRVWLYWKKRQNLRSKVRMNSRYNSGSQLLSSVLGLLCKSWSITFWSLREPGPISIVRPAAGSFHGEYVQSRFISYFVNYFMHHERLLSRDVRGLRSAGAGRSVKFVGVGGGR